MQEVADNNCVYRNEIHHAVGERTQVLQDVAADPTLPRTKSVRCANCNHGEAVFFQVGLTLLLIVTVKAILVLYTVLTSVFFQFLYGEGEYTAGFIEYICTYEINF